MAENKQVLRLKLAQAHQALHQAHARIAALEAELAALHTPVQVVENAAAPFAPQTPSGAKEHYAPPGPTPLTEQGTAIQPADTLSKRYAQRLEILHLIDHGLLEAVSIPALVEVVLKHIRQLIPCQRAAVILFDWATAEWLIFADNGQQPSTLRRGVRYPMPPQWQASFGPSPTRVIDDLRLLPNPLPVYQQLIEEGFVAGIQALLVGGGKPLGLLGLNATTPAFFTPEHQEIAQEVATQLAIALQQRQLAEVAERASTQLAQQMAELQQTSATLRRSETLFRATFEQAAVGITLCGLDGHWRQVNQRFCAIVGYTSAELAAHTFHTLSHPADLAADLAATQQLLAGEIPFYTMRKRYYHKSGQLVWANLTVSLVRDDQGLPDYFIAIVEDITHITQIEQALQQSEVRYRQVIDDQADLIGRFQRDFTLTFVNRAYSETFGKTPEELIGQSFLDFVPPAYHPVLIAQLTALNAATPVLTNENPVVLADGTQRWFQWTNRLILDETGQPLAYQSVGRDITVQKQLQAAQQHHVQALEEMQQFLEATLAAFPASTVVLASDGAILRCNTAWQQFGAANGSMAPNHYLGENYLAVCDTVIGADAREAALAAAGIRAVIVGQQPTFYLEYPCHSPTTQRWFALRVTPFAEAPPRRVVVAHLEITERIQMEEAEREQRRFAEALRDSLAALTTVWDEPRVLQQILDSALTVVPADAGSIVLLEKEAGRVAYLQGFGPEATHAVLNVRFPVESLAYDRLLINQRPYIIPDTQANADWLPLPFTEWIRSSVGIPIQRHGHLVGVLTVDSATPEHFQPRDLEKLQAFARYASLALERTEHVTALEQRVTERTTELQATKERAEAILYYSVEGMLLVDADLCILQTNPAFQRLVGAVEAEPVMGTLRDLLHPDDLPAINAVLQTVVQKQQGQQVELRCYRKDGTLFDAELSLGFIQANSLVLTLRDITERKARERQLLFDACLQENVTDAVIATDLEFRIQSWNRAAETIYGWTAAEVIGRTIQEVLSTEFSAETPVEQVRRAFAESGYWTGEVIQRHKAGHPLHILGSTVLFKDNQGIPFGVVSVNHNITARKQTEDALRESEAKFRLLVEAAPIAIVITDQAGRIMLVNAQAERCFGYERNELVGQLIELLVPAAVRDQHVQQRLQYMATPQVRRMGSDLDLLARAKDGRAFPIEIELSWIETQTGPLVMSFILDITERKQAAAALEEQRRFLRQVIDVSPSLIFVKDDTGRFLLANPRVAHLYNTTVESLIGRCDADFNRDPQEVAALLAADQQVIMSGEPLVFEEALTNTRGEMQWFQTTKVPIMSADGHSKLVLGIATDITARKQNELLMQQALAKEREVVDLKARFVSMASHEFRTPLASILALTETLRVYQQRLSAEQVQQRLGQIQEQVGYLKGMMDDVLQLAQLQARRTQFNPSRFNLDAFCQSLLDEFQNQPTVAHVLRYTCNDPAREVYLDPKLMRQILNNLVSNALKYSPSTTPIQVTLTYTADALALSVADEGIGIPAADIPHLFEPFHRAVNVGTIAGTGLGLVITKESVELHGGAIAVESQVGRGTTFTVCLPLASGESEQYAPNPCD